MITHINKYSINNMEQLKNAKPGKQEYPSDLEETKEHRVEGNTKGAGASYMLSQDSIKHIQEEAELEVQEERSKL